MSCHCFLFLSIDPQLFTLGNTSWSKACDLEKYAQRLMYRAEEGVVGRLHCALHVRERQVAVLGLLAAFCCCTEVALIFHLAVLYVSKPTSGQPSVSRL